MNSYKMTKFLSSKFGMADGGVKKFLLYYVRKKFLKIRNKSG